MMFHHHSIKRLKNDLVLLRLNMVKNIRSLLELNYLQKSNKMKTKNLKPKIKDIDPLTVIYVNSIGAYEGKGTEEAWNKVCALLKQNRFFGRHTAFIGISHDDPNVTEAEKLRYDACVVSEKNVRTARRSRSENY